MISSIYGVEYAIVYQQRVVCTWLDRQFFWSIEAAEKHAAVGRKTYSNDVEQTARVVPATVE